MHLIAKSSKIIFGVILGIFTTSTLYALPAMFSLGWKTRPGLQPLTIEAAARQLAASEKSGWDLAEGARALVADRMDYSRRNSYDSASRAFERGYGYCQQQSYALVELLSALGIDSKVVHAYQNRFPDGVVTPHAWVRVTLNDETRDVDPLFYDAEARVLDFEVLSDVHVFTPAFRIFAGWGSGVVNAHRYYRTGKDL